MRIAAATLLLTAAAAAQSPVANQLAPFQAKVRQDMSGIPNYTCLETIERARREPRARAFKSVDTIRLEVSTVSGKEMYAWPGSRRFEDRDVAALVMGGTIGSGMFSMFAQNLFLTPKGTLEFQGPEKLDGRPALRTDFRLTREESGLQLATNGDEAIVPSRGSFWFDPASLDLIRLDLYAVNIPPRLRLDEVVFRTTYARAHIGATDALLPQRSELSMTHASGEISRNVMEFSNCHEYLSESTITFDAPSAAPLPVESQGAIREVELPANLTVPLQMETAINSKSTSVGDTVRARLLQAVTFPGGVIPAGALVTGHICKLDRTVPAVPFAIGIQFSDLEWEGHHAALFAALIDVDSKSAGKQKPVRYNAGYTQQAVINSEVPGIGIFYIKSSAVEIPAGLRMLWRTLPRSGRIE